MATTTNYGWTTPDDTALVKDGAAAIRTLGSSVDTTTKALNPSTTLGDIEYRSSTANTNTRLGIGTTGQVLTVAGGVPSWAAAPTGGMTLINTGGTTLTGASVTVSSIPSTYRNLQIVLSQPLCADNGEGIINLRFNSDTGTNYRTATSSGFFNQNANGTFIFGGQGSINTAPTYSQAILDVPNYADANVYKLVSMLVVEDASSANLTNYRGLWYSTSAINSVTVAPYSGNWTSGTVYVYGVK